MRKRSQMKVTANARSPGPKTVYNKENVASGLASPVQEEEDQVLSGHPTYNGVLSPASFNNLKLQLEEALMRE
jgi:hypothetical protein